MACVDRMAAEGLRVIAVAQRRDVHADADVTADEIERELELLGLLAFLDPAREEAADALAACRRAGIRVAMITGDHPATARAIASRVGLLGVEQIVLEGKDLPDDEAVLGAMLDHDGIVVSRVAPEDKLRITRALQARGHVVAMTGDGVNDGPALQEADIGVAMGRSRHRRGPRGRRPRAPRRRLRHDRRRHRAGPGHVRQRPPVPDLPPHRQRRRAHALRRLGLVRGPVPARPRRAPDPLPRHRHRPPPGAGVGSRERRHRASSTIHPNGGTSSIGGSSFGSSVCSARSRRCSR